jgi:hypothetical protein
MLAGSQGVGEILRRLTEDLEQHAEESLVRAV